MIIELTRRTSDGLFPISAHPPPSVPDPLARALVLLTQNFFFLIKFPQSFVHTVSLRGKLHSVFSLSLYLVHSLKSPSASMKPYLSTATLIDLAFNLPILHSWIDHITQVTV